jgi:ectoine hydroxylase-related dioxygenase (phytanoyl-CoA dioxygenase family)
VDITTALTELGVTSGDLTDKERARLDEDGFLPLEDLLDADQLEAIRRRTAELTTAEGERAGLEVHQEAGTDRLSDLVNKDPMFDVCLTHPRVLAAMAHVLEDFKMFSLNSRAALPGQGHQALHTDFAAPPQPGHYQVCNSIWLLDDFTEHNGATRIVPGSHRSGTVPGDALADPAATHPDEALVLGRAGTVVVFNSHAWHGGTLNTTDRPRRALHGAFCRRGVTQQLDQKAYLRPETAARLSPAATYILGV